MTLSPIISVTQLTRWLHRQLQWHLPGTHGLRHRGRNRQQWQEETPSALVLTGSHRETPGMDGSLYRPSLPLLLLLGICIQQRTYELMPSSLKYPRTHKGSQLGVISRADWRGKNLLQRGLGGFKIYFSSKMKVNFGVKKRSL